MAMDELERERWEDDGGFAARDPAGLVFRFDGAA